MSIQALGHVTARQVVNRLWEAETEAVDDEPDAFDEADIDMAEIDEAEIDEAEAGFPPPAPAARPQGQRAARRLMAPAPLPPTPAEAEQRLREGVLTYVPGEAVAFWVFAAALLEAADIRWLGAAVALATVAGAMLFALAAAAEEARAMDSSVTPRQVLRAGWFNIMVVTGAATLVWTWLPPASWVNWPSPIIPFLIAFLTIAALTAYAKFQPTPEMA